MTDQEEYMTLEEFSAEFEDAILITFLASLMVATLSFVATFAKDEHTKQFTFTYHWRMLGFWICIASIIAGFLSGILCMLRDMDKKSAVENRRRREFEAANERAETERRRADIAEAKLAECQEACCKKPDGSRRLPAKGTCVHNGHRPNPRPATNNDRRLYN